MKFLGALFRQMPLILCIITPCVFFLTYGIAMAQNHVYPLLPYISDTGTYPPESCLFTLLVNMVAYLLCTIIYVRYREISAAIKKKTHVKISLKCNKIAAAFGYFSSFGLSVVASYQETNNLIIHLGGALVCFFCGIIYFSFQTLFTRKINPQAKILFWFRLILTVLNVLFFVGTFAPIKNAFADYKGEDVRKWTIEDGGYSYHLISTFSEWFLVFSFLAYINTIFWDFRKIRVIPIQIQFLEEKPQNIEDLEDDDKAEKKEKMLI